MIFIHFTNNKNEFCNCFIKLKSHIKKQTGCKIKILRSDNGTKHKNEQLEDFLEEELPPK